MQKDRKAVSDVTLEDEMPYKGDLSEQHYTGQNFLEDVAVAVVAECGDYDIALVAAAYNVGGEVWGVDDAVLQQTTFMAVPHKQQGMQDNPFISHRIEATRPSAFEIRREVDSVVKQVGNRLFTARSPHWEVHGEHMGVDCNVTMSGLGPTDWHLGKWVDIGRNGRGGYSQLCWAEGDITANSVRYEFECGYGIQAHEIVSEAWSKPLETDNPIQYFYYMYFSDDVQVSLYMRPAAGSIYARVVIDGKVTLFGWDEVAVDELKWWVDPRTGMRIPVRWHVNCSTDDVMLDVNIAAYGRAIYGFYQTSAYKLHYNYLARTEGSILEVGGLKIRLEARLSWVEWGITTPLGLSA
jgi:hypothetical protein